MVPTKNIDTFIGRNYNNIVGSMVKHNEYYNVNLLNRLDQEHGYPHIGSIILSQSKKIMSHLFWLMTNADLVLEERVNYGAGEWERQNEKFGKIENFRELVAHRLALAEKVGRTAHLTEIYYTDTDSTHIETKYMPIIKYLIGDQMCQFHSDFKTPPGVNGVMPIIKGDIGFAAYKSEFVMSKVYCDSLIGIKDGKFYGFEHKRMKGMPSKNIPGTAFEELNKGGVLNYNLLEESASKFMTKKIAGQGLFSRQIGENREIKCKDFNKKAFFYVSNPYGKSGHFVKKEFIWKYPNAPTLKTFIDFMSPVEKRDAIDVVKKLYDIQKIPMLKEGTKKILPKDIVNKLVNGKLIAVSKNSNIPKVKYYDYIGDKLVEVSELYISLYYKHVQEKWCFTREVNTKYYVEMDKRFNIKRNYKTLELLEAPTNI